MRWQSANGSGRVIHGGNGDGHSRRRRSALSIADRVGDRIGAVEIRLGRVGQDATRPDRHRAIGRARRCDRQRIAVGVAVIGKDRNRDGGIFVGRCGIIGRNRRRVRHRPAKCLRRRQPARIARCHDNRIGTTTNLTRRTVNRPADHAGRGVDRQTRRQACCAIGQCRIIDIGKARCRGHRNTAGRIDIDARRQAADRRRRIVDGSDRNRCCRRGRVADRVGDCVGKGFEVCAVHVGIGHERKRACCCIGDRQFATRQGNRRAHGKGNAVDFGNRQRIAARIGISPGTVVCKQIASQRCVFDGRQRIILGNRRRIENDAKFKTIRANWTRRILRNGKSQCRESSTYLNAARRRAVRIG